MTSSAHGGDLQELEPKVNIIFFSINNIKSEIFYNAIYLNKIISVCRILLAQLFLIYTNNHFKFDFFSFVGLLFLLIY